MRYNHYSKVLPVVSGELASDAIDDALALSFVFKHCSIHLVEAEAGGAAPTGAAAGPAHHQPERPVPRLPVAEGGEEEAGTCASVAFQCLPGRTYWALVQEDAAEQAAAEARQAAYLAAKAAGSGAAAGAGSEGIVREKVEGCSCIWVRGTGAWGSAAGTSRRARAS